MSTALRVPTWLRRRSVIIPAQVVVLGLAVWLLVVPQLQRSGTSLSVLFDVDNGWIPVAAAAELLSLGAYALTTRSMLPRASRPGLLRVLRIDLSSIALGHCLPDGGVAGTALSWRLLVAAGVPSAEAVFAKLAQGVVAFVVLMTLLLGSFGFGLITTSFGRWNTLPVAACAAVLFVVLCLIALSRRQAVRRALYRTIHRLPRYGPRVATLLARLYHRHAVQQVRGTFTAPRHVLLTAGFAAANWALDGIALWACVAAYGPSVGITGLAAAFAIQAFAAWLPLTPSGLGISEGLMIPALIAFGASGTSAVLGVLTWRVLAYWLPMPIGAVAYGSLQVRRKHADVQVPAPQPEPATRH